MKEEYEFGFEDQKSVEIHVDKHQEPDQDFMQPKEFDLEKLGQDTKEYQPKTDEKSDNSVVLLKHHKGELSSKDQEEFDDRIEELKDSLSGTQQMHVPKETALLDGYEDTFNTKLSDRMRAQNLNNIKTSKKAGSYEVLENGNKLMNRDYEVGGKKKTGERKASKEMDAIFAELEALNVFFDTVEFTKDDEDVFKTSGTALLDRMKHLMEKCDDYLAKKNPWTAEGVARYKLVDKIGERLGKDIAGLEEKMVSFSLMSQEEKDHVNSWADFLNLERSVAYEDKKDGVKISSAGGNTSEVVVIEKDGKKLFFKKESKMEAVDLRDVATAKFKEIKEGINKDVEDYSVDYYKMIFTQNFKEELASREGMMKTAGEVLFDVDTTSDRYADLLRYYDKLGLSKFGRLAVLSAEIEGIEDEEHKKNVKAALGNIFTDIKKAIVTSDVGIGTARIKAGEGLVKRNVAASRLAHLLDLDGLVPQSEMATISVNDKKMYGVVMSDASGLEAGELTKDKFRSEHDHEDVEYSPNAIRDLLNMQIFDALCGQTDRHEYNRLLQFEQVERNGKKVNVVKSAKGIDGDFSFGRIDYSDFKSSKKADIMRMEDSHGLHAPGMSAELAEKILALSPEVLDYEMIGLLNRDERAALKDRLIGIQGAIKKQKEYESKHQGTPTKFIPEGKWKDFRIRYGTELRADKKKRLKAYDNTYLNPNFVIGITINYNKQ